MGERDAGGEGTGRLDAGGRPSILLVLAGGKAPLASLQQARARAERWDGCLHVLQSEERGGTGRGTLEERVAAHAQALHASLIVLPAERAHAAGLATSLAAATGTPVLIAREGRAEGPIVAATDLLDPQHAVLRSAARWERAASTPVIALHNVPPLPVLVGSGGTWPWGALLPEDPALERRRQCLASATRQLMLEAALIVRADCSAAGAILDEAQRRGASLLIVGATARSRFRRWLVGSVAEQVAERAPCSVLVAPVRQRG